MTVSMRKLVALVLVGGVFSSPVLSAEWSGGYGGIHVGKLKGKSNAHYDTSGNGFDHQVSGTTYGAQLGYNFELKGFVLGIEGDYSVSGTSGTTACPNPAWTCSSEINRLFSIRPRVGAKVDDFLLYGTAGFALGSVKGQSESPAGNIYSEGFKQKNGWTYGVGTEYLLPEAYSFGKTSIRLEYRYTSLGESAHEVFPGHHHIIHNKLRSATIGANFHF